MNDDATVTTRDVDQARVEVANLFCPHALRPDRGSSLDLNLTAHRIGDVGLITLDYGTPVRIDPGDLENFYLVQLPRHGRAEVQQGGHSVCSTPGLASVLSPGARVSMHWGERNPQSIVYLKKTAVERQLSRLLGRPADRPLTFQLGMATRDPAVASWQRTVDFVRTEIEQGSPFVDDIRYAAQVEELIIGRLLSAQPNNYGPVLAATSVASGRTVRSACVLLQEHHAEPLTVSDVAEALGVSVRALQDGFRRELDVSPMTWLRQARLDAVRADLQDAERSVGSVTSVALAHGFTHLGRFAAEYRRRFGETPSATLAS